MWAPVTGDPVRGSTINFIEILKTPYYVFGLGTPELVYPDKPAGPVNNDKKVNLLAILEDFWARSVLIQSIGWRFLIGIVRPEALAWNLEG